MPVEIRLRAGVCVAATVMTADVAIALRTGVVKDGMLYAQAGGGVVADSEPEAEWQETQNKARALFRAAEIAEAGLDSKI